MRVDVSMQTENRFHVGHWWASSPDFVIASLKAQLEAAQAVWPELRSWKIENAPETLPARAVKRLIEKG